MDQLIVDRPNEFFTMQDLLANLGLVVSMMTALWVVSLFRRDASIVDIFWGLGFVLIAWRSRLALDEAGPRSILLVGLTTFWGVRLAGYLARRNWGKPEDYRYRAFREHYGPWFPLLSLFMVFLLQGLIMVVVSLPLTYGMRRATPLGWLDAAGMLVWLTGWLFESVGDYQLARFRRDPANRGRVMDRGLWRYTRHPNYFGDFLLWWGLYLIAASGGAAWTIVSPLLMSYLLIRVSGVAMLEKSIGERRAGYDEYSRRTSSFFPWPPKSSA